MFKVKLCMIYADLYCTLEYSVLMNYSRILISLRLAELHFFIKQTDQYHCLLLVATDASSIQHSLVCALSWNLQGWNTASSTSLCWQSHSLLDSHCWILLSFFYFSPLFLTRPAILVSLHSCIYFYLPFDASSKAEGFYIFSFLVCKVHV